MIERARKVFSTQFEKPMRKYLLSSWTSFYANNMHLKVEAFGARPKKKIQQEEKCKFKREDLLYNAKGDQICKQLRLLEVLWWHCIALHSCLHEKVPKCVWELPGKFVQCYQLGFENRRVAG
jgi:hypothetical protein